jgi:hypothetical protein
MDVSEEDGAEKLVPGVAKECAIIGTLLPEIRLASH